MALKIYQKQDPSSCIRMQLITPIDMAEEAANLISFSNELSYRGTPIDPQLIIDPRLRRMTMYLNDEPVIDIFNTASYLPSPINIIDNINVGIPFILLKFRLIDIWTIKVLKGIKVIKPDYAQHMIGVFRQSYKNIFEYLNLKIYRDDVDKYKYVGVFVDYETEIKRSNASDTKFYKPYYPLIVYKSA